ncbi:MAG: twin-arginine translocase TatA/TatE family subunit [Spongiibacteraceae bacterium]|nr:twin-arginine translocase TatA/TatE family subunit [Spongiibacteraceae bacterium]
MSISLWQVALVAFLILLLFGRGRISGLMGDFALGIKSFKRGLFDEDAVAAPLEKVKENCTPVMPLASERRHQAHDS